VYSGGNVKTQSTKGETVMHWRFKEMQGRYQAATGERLTFDAVIAATGLARQTIANLSTGRAKRLDLGTMETLLNFFSDALGEPLTTSDLLEYRPDA